MSVLPQDPSRDGTYNISLARAVMLSPQGIGTQETLLSLHDGVCRVLVFATKEMDS